MGLIGGMTWVSTVDYYRIINGTVSERLGGLHSAKCLMYSVDFGEISEWMLQEKWEEIKGRLTDAALRLKAAGADFIVICTNTMHKMADDIQKDANIPLIHIADAAAEKIKEMGLKKVGLLGTKFTMEEDFYRKRIKENYNIEVIIPGESEREIVNDVIFNELSFEVIKQSSKDKYLEIIRNLTLRGAEGIILGCTETPILIKQEDVEVPVFDTTTIHAVAAVDFALK